MSSSFQKNKQELIFLAKFGLISQCTLLLARYTSPKIFQLFYAFQLIRFVKSSKTPFCFPFNFFVRLETINQIDVKTFSDCG